ncbi:ubiquitin-specific protease [Asimina triloba]
MPIFTFFVCQKWRAAMAKKQEIMHFVTLASKEAAHACLESMYHHIIPESKEVTQSLKQCTATDTGHSALCLLPRNNIVCPT